MKWLAFRGHYYLQLLTLEYTVVEVERKNTRAKEMILAELTFTMLRYYCYDILKLMIIKDFSERNQTQNSWTGVGWMKMKVRVIVRKNLLIGDGEGSPGVDFSIFVRSRKPLPEMSYAPHPFHSQREPSHLVRMPSQRDSERMQPESMSSQKPTVTLLASRSKLTSVKRENWVPIWEIKYPDPTPSSLANTTLYCPQMTILWIKWFYFSYFLSYTLTHMYTQIQTYLHIYFPKAKLPKH